MSTLNGFGTLYYGWRHAKGGTATATKWFALSWLPIVPLHRVLLRVLGGFRSKQQNIKAELGGLMVSQTDRFEIIERLPLSLKEIAITLAKTYIGLPSLLVGPILLLIGFMKLLQSSGIEVKPGSIAFNVFIGGFFLAIVHALIQVVRAIRRTRGWQR